MAKQIILIIDAISSHNYECFKLMVSSFNGILLTVLQYVLFSQ